MGTLFIVSMKSGLEGRNNPKKASDDRPRDDVSMKSGLEGRNNHRLSGSICSARTQSQ